MSSKDSTNLAEKVIETSPPLLSIIIPTFNRVEDLKEALKSVVAQNYPNLEIIVVDDGSTDPDQQLYLDSNLKVDFPSVKLLSQKNGYLGKARNKGVKASKGEFLTFLDDDDVLIHPGALREAMKAILTSGADVLGSLTDVIRSRTPKPGKDFDFRYLYVGGCPESGMYLNTFGGYNILISRRAFREVGGYTEEMGVGSEDWELAAKLTLKGYKYLILPESIAYHRELHSDSMIKVTDNEKGHHRVLRAYKETIPKILHGAIDVAIGMYYHK